MADIPDLRTVPWARFFLADADGLSSIEAAFRGRLDPSMLPECRPVHLRIHPAERVAVEAWAEQFSTSEPDVLESIVALVQFVLTRRPAQGRKRLSGELCARTFRAHKLRARAVELEDKFVVLHRQFGSLAAQIDARLHAMGIPPIASPPAHPPGDAPESREEVEITDAELSDLCGRFARAWVVQAPGSAVWEEIDRRGIGRLSAWPMTMALPFGGQQAYFVMAQCIERGITPQEFFQDAIRWAQWVSANAVGIKTSQFREKLLSKFVAMEAAAYRASAILDALWTCASDLGHQADLLAELSQTVLSKAACLAKPRET